jgi:hypothetical protein
MAPLNLDDRDLAEITSEIGYRLEVELRRSQIPIPPYIERLVRSLDNLPANRSPSNSLVNSGTA